MSNLCPKCLKDDQVQKISAIITSGTYTTTHQVPVQGEIAGRKIYGTAPQTGIETTALAQKLAIDFSEKSVNEMRKKVVEQDEKEFVKRYLEKHPGHQDSKAANIFAIAAWVVLAGGALCSFATSSINNIFAFILCLGGLGAFFVLIVLSVKFNNPNKREWRKKVDQAVTDHNKETAENYMRTIQRAKRKYSNMYYCHRDDVIFVPDETGWANSSEIMDFVSR